jgi:hypothetical protein
MIEFVFIFLVAIFIAWNVYDFARKYIGRKS